MVITMFLSARDYNHPPIKSTPIRVKSNIHRGVKTLCRCHCDNILTTTTRHWFIESFITILTGCCAIHYFYDLNRFRRLSLFVYVWQCTLHDYTAFTKNSIGLKVTGKAGIKQIFP